MSYSGVYGIVLLLHLIAAIFLIGPLGIAGTLSAKWVKDGDVGALKAGHRTTKVYSLLAIIVPLLGIGLVQIKLHGLHPWKMSQAWVGASLALVIVAIGVSLIVIAPAQAKALTALEAAAPEVSAPLTEDPALEAEVEAHEPSKSELKAEAKAEARAAKHPPASLELLTGRLQAASGVQMACWAVIVVLMVFKPGT